MKENENRSKQDSFIHILIGDVVSAGERLDQLDTPTHRREFIKSVFSAIEGLHWHLKNMVSEHADIVLSLSPHEKSALIDETYSVSESGKIKSQPKYVPLPNAIRFVIEISTRYMPSYSVDFNHVGWNNLKGAILVRNRLTHPKNVRELSVSDKEIQMERSAFHWYLALILEISGFTKDHMIQVMTILSEKLGVLNKKP